MPGQGLTAQEHGVVPQNRWPIQPRRDAIVAALTVLVAFTVTVLVVWRFSIAHQASSVMADAERIAKVAAGLLDHQALTALATPEPLDASVYNVEARRLAYLRGTQSRLDGLYALVPSGDQWVTMSDAQQRKHVDPSRLPAAAREAYTTRRTSHAPAYAGERGNVLSVFTPIEDASGNVLGIVGADVLEVTVRDKGGVADRILLYGMLFTVACMVGMGLLVYHMRSSMRAVMMAQESRVVALEHNAETMTQAQEEAESMLASMSHEVRTPLTAILGFTELLLEPNEDLAVLRGHAQTIRRNGLHLLGVLNNALDISKIDAGMMRVHAQPFDPGRLLEEVTELFVPRARERQITLRPVREGKLPECIDADEFRVRQILLNLFSNALKFTEKGGVTATVRYDFDKQVVEFSVADTGVGITPEQFEQIFKPYQQSAQQDPRRFGGTGLGLAISKRLASLMQGDLSVTSQVGVGSTFTMRIPAPVATAEMREQREKAVPSDTWRPRPSWRVLVVEDSIEHQKILYTTLRAAGHSVEVCGTGERALKVLRESETLREPFTIVVLDAHLPKMSGAAVAQALRDQGFRGPILVLTADQSESTRSECLLAGCNEVLPKPIDGERLLNALHRWVHGSKSLGVA